MPKKIDLSDLLDDKTLDEFLPASPPPPSEVISPPECLILFWQRSTCSCGRVYESEEHGPLIRHTLSRRQGFGLHVLGKVLIPWVPGMDTTDLPTEVRCTTKQIFTCPECIGRRSSLPLFPDTATQFVVKKNGTAMSPHLARWYDMHSTSKPEHVTEAIKTMHMHKVEIDDLLTFKTTEHDLRACAMQLCDTEKQIEL